MFRCIVTTTKRYAKHNVLYPVPQYAVVARTFTASIPVETP